MQCFSGYQYWPHTCVGLSPAWDEGCTEAGTAMLASVNGAHTQMRDKEQLNISVNWVTVEQNIWLKDIIEVCILGLGTLEQLRATMDTVSKWLLFSMEANTRHARESLETVSPGAKQSPVHNNLTAGSSFTKRQQKYKQYTIYSIQRDYKDIVVTHCVVHQNTAEHQVGREPWVMAKHKIEWTEASGLMGCAVHKHHCLQSMLPSMSC